MMFKKGGYANISNFFNSPSNSYRGLVVNGVLDADDLDCLYDMIIQELKDYND